MTANPWRSNRRWAIAHTVDTATARDFLGKSYISTTCGRRVRVDGIYPDTSKPHCPVCASRATDDSESVEG